MEYNCTPRLNSPSWCCTFFTLISEDMNATKNGSDPSSNGHPPKYDNELVGFLTSLQLYVGKVLSDSAVYLTHTLIFFKRQLLFIAACAVVGAAISVAYYQSQPEFYRSSMVITSDFMDVDLLEKTMQDLNHTTSTAQTGVLAGVFNAQPEEVEPLLSFSVEVRQDSITALRLPKPKLEAGKKVAQADKPGKTELALVDRLMESLRPDYYYITAESADPSVFPKLEAWMLHMLEHNPSLTRERDFQLAELDKKKLKLEEEMLKLDRLKMIYHEAMDKSREIKITKNTPGDVVINQAQIDPLPVYNQYLEYFNEALATQTEINSLGTMVTVLSGFSPSGTRGNQHWKVSAMHGLALGGAAGVALALMLALIRYLNRFEVEIRSNEQRVEEPVVNMTPPPVAGPKTNGHHHKEAAEAAAATVDVAAGG